MSPRKWPKPRKRNYFGWVLRDSCAPGCILVICPFEENRNSKTDSWNWLLAPNIQTLWSKLDIFVPSIPLRPRCSMLLIPKRCLWFPIWGYQKFCSLPKKNGFLARLNSAGPKLALLVILGQKFAFLAHFMRYPTKNNANEVPMWFSVIRVPKLLLPPLKIRPQNSQFWPQIYIFGHFGPNNGISGPFGVMPDQNNNANEVPRWFSDMSVPNLRMFGPKMVIFAPKYALLGTFNTSWLH